MSQEPEKIKFLLGSDSITVFVSGKTYAVNKEAHTYEMVINAVKANDLVALESALEIRKFITKSLTAGASNRVRVEQDQIFYDDREVTGLIASRIFEVIRLGLDAKPMIKFLENLMANPSKRAVDELFSFLDACKLPITDDGHFLAYKRVRDDYTDVHSGKFDNSVGQILEMPRNAVDEDKNRTCSAGLHFCSYDYLAHFGGDRIMILKINPADVVAIPADYNNTKGRTCRYEVVGELALDDYNKLPVEKIKDEFTPQYGAGWNEPEVDDEVEDEEESWEESWEESEEEEVDVEDEISYLDSDEIEEIVEAYNDGSKSVHTLASEYITYPEVVEELVRRAAVAKRRAAVAKQALVADDNTTGKLTPTQVREIRNLLGTSKVSLASIARKYGVHPRTIGRIRDGEAWANV